MIIFSCAECGQQLDELPDGEDIDVASIGRRHQCAGKEETDE